MLSNEYLKFHHLKIYYNTRETLKKNKVKHEHHMYFHPNIKKYYWVMYLQYLRSQYIIFMWRIKVWYIHIYCMLTITCTHNVVFFQIQWFILNEYSHFYRGGKSHNINAIISMKFLDARMCTPKQWWISHMEAIILVFTLS